MCTKRLWLCVWAGTLLYLLASPVSAQTDTNRVIIKQTPPAGNGNGNGGNNGNNGNAQGKGKPAINDRPTEIPRDPALNPQTDPDQKGKPATPGRPDKTATPTDIEDGVKKFQAERENYLKNVQALNRLQKDATTEERAAIREQMKESLERLKEQNRALMKEMRDRAKEMKNELSPDLGRVIDGAKNEGRGR